jgi:LuxR family transcriptional regulator, quorum-sensing system regulator BjaR1
MRADLQSALEFAQGADDIRQAAELNRRFGDVVHQFGVRFFTTVVAARPGQPLTPQVLGGEVLPEWTNHYAERGFARVDPVLRMLFSTNHSFTWREAAARAEAPLAKRMFDEVKDVTGADGALVVPLHDCSGLTSAVILSGPGVEFGPDVRPALHMAALYFSGVANDLLNKRWGPEACPLTARQLECLRWVMEGKTDWEIGEILGIAESTVHNHIEAAKRILGVGTRTQAFMEALRRGWLV